MSSFSPTCTPTLFSSVPQSCQTLFTLEHFNRTMRSGVSPLNFSRNLDLTHGVESPISGTMVAKNNQERYGTQGDPDAKGRHNMGARRRRAREGIPGMFREKGRFVMSRGRMAVWQTVENLEKGFLTLPILMVPWFQRPAVLISTVFPLPLPLSCRLPNHHQA